ncbi:MAG: hypothetical protein QME12_03845 [Nanoarchaeota archaeon]|nr:hypothetical protein [Nanoarchaeota archaeon]
MLKRVMLIAIALIILASLAFAQELPEGYKKITGARGTAIYNPNIVKELFDVEEIDGVLAIKYAPAIQRGARSKIIGYLSGLITPSESGGKQLKASRIEESNEDAKFVSAEGLYTNITGALFRIDASEFPKLGFLLDDARYRNREYSFACKEECRMRAVVSMDGAYLNMSGEGVAVHRSKFSEYRSSVAAGRGPNIEERYLTPLKNLDKIVVTNNSEMDTFQSGSSAYSYSRLFAEKHRNYETLMITAIAGEDSRFGKLGVSSKGESVRLEHQTHPGVTEDADSYYIITADNAKVVPETGANYVIFSKNTEASPLSSRGITIELGGHDLLRLVSGVLLVPKDEGVYKICSSINVRSAQGPASLQRHPFLGDKGCGYIDPLSGKLYFKPRSYRNSAFGDESTYPFNLIITLPSSHTYSNLNIEKFEETGDKRGAIVLERAGVGNRIAFYANDIQVAMMGEGHIFDFGVNFRAWVFKMRSSAGDICERIWCALSTRACFVKVCEGCHDDMPCDEPTTQWYGFTEESRRGIRCRNEADCGVDSRCIEGHCVTESTCEEITGGADAAKLNILFVNDITGARKAEFNEFLNSKFLMPNDLGLFNVKPFSNNIGKLSILSLSKEKMPVNPTANPVMATQYMNEMIKKCPIADEIIIVSSQSFTSHADAMGGNIFFSLPAAQGLVGAGKEGRIFLHEFGHSFGNLADEYVGIGTLFFYEAPNCVEESEAEDVWTRFIGRSGARHILREARGEQGRPYRGCGGQCRNIGGACQNYLKPSTNSLMHEADHIKGPLEAGKEFNEVSQKVLQEKLNEYS